MKYFFLSLLSLAIFVTYPGMGQIYGAVSTSPSPATTAASMTGDETEKLSKLKDKIESRVKQLKLVEKRGIIGKVDEVTGTTKLTLTDMKGTLREVDIDELTKFSSPGSKTFGISDIQKGTVISVLGLYNKETKHILARFITLETLPIIYNGMITSVDKKNFTVTIMTSQNKEAVIDHENTTKNFMYSREDGLTKIGFSKIVAGQRVFVVGTTDTKDKTILDASRIIVFPDLQATSDTAPTTQSQTTPTKNPTKKPY